MPTIDQYSKSHKLRLLLQGPSGSGKTTTACQFPKAWVIDCDRNLDGAIRYLTDNKKPLPVGYDLIDDDDAGKPVAEDMRAARLKMVFARIKADPNVDTIVLDNMTRISDYFKAEVLRENPTKTKGFEQTSWGFYDRKWMLFCGDLMNCGKHVVLIAHEKVDKDELDGSTKYFLLQQGSFKDKAGAMFTDVWRCEVEPGMGIGAKPVYNINTVQSFRNHGLKNSLGLPPKFHFDWATIQTKLQ